ncbi:uncharacterized protein V6R79_011446 [Siganus canaliculatus]
MRFHGDGATARVVMVTTQRQRQWRLNAFNPCRWKQRYLSSTVVVPAAPGGAGLRLQSEFSCFTLDSFKDRKKGTFSGSGLRSERPLLLWWSMPVLLCPVSRFRSSEKQNVCVQLLQDGFHRSFSELFRLLSSDRDQRASAEPDSVLWLQTPLEEQQDKLETMKLHLSRAEEAQMTESWSSVADERLFLGHYFSAPEDLWLRLHFYHSCAEVRGRFRPATEARACLAEIYLQQGELEWAGQQAELCISEADASDWLDSDGRPLRLRARQTLSRVYLQSAVAAPNTNDHKEALALLHKSYSTAQESKDKQLQGEVCYQLGLTYQSAGDHHDATQFLDVSAQIFETLQDADALAKSYSAMVKSAKSEAEVEELIQRLEDLKATCQRRSVRDTLVEVYMSLGFSCYSQRQFQKGDRFFQRSYELASDDEVHEALVDEVELLQVLVAASRARSLIRKHSDDVLLATPTAM